MSFVHSNIRMRFDRQISNKLNQNKYLDIEVGNIVVDDNDDDVEKRCNKYTIDCKTIFIDIINYLLNLINYIVNSNIFYYLFLFVNNCFLDFPLDIFYDNYNCEYDNEYDNEYNCDCEKQCWFNIL